MIFIIKNSTALLITFLLIVPTLNSKGQSNIKSIIQMEQYKLVWSDEFNNNGKPDSTNWIFENGFVRNNEQQWYQAENAHCINGNLIIEARRENKLNHSYTAGSDDWRKNREFAEYTSSSLLTKGLRSWLYGRFEMRAKLDCRLGLWPAFWTLGENGDWPHNGEIDVMEYYQKTILANFAWGNREKWQPIWDDFKLPLDSLIKSDQEWTQKFHTWRMDWDKDGIALFLDDQMLNSINLSTAFNKDEESKNPFRQPHYIILNLAVGGTQGGDPSQTEFPAYYLIDYVRVYQK